MATQNEENNTKIIADDKININFKITKENTILGKGAFGTVYLGAKTNADRKKEKVALKEIPKQLNDEESQKALQNEIDICEKLDNTNIVKMIKIEKNIDDKIYLVYELCNGGDLRRYMDYFKAFDEELIQIIMIQMVNALFELHRKNVVHHDIKPENILIQLFPEEEMTPEIEKKIESIKEATSKKHKQNNNQVKNNNNQITNQNNGVNQNNHNNNNFYQNNTYCQNNINYYQANNNNYYQNNNNNYYFQNNNNNYYFQNNNNNYYQANNNNNAMNNNTYHIPHIKSNNNPNQTYYNQVYPSIPNQFNNNYLYNNFNINNNFNQNYYQTNNNLNPNFNYFQKDNLNNPDINNLNLIKSKTSPQINKITNNFNNKYYNNNNQNNQDNDNNIEKPIDKSEILKVLKKAQFKLSDFGLSKIKSDKNKKDGKGDDQGNRCGSPLYMSPELFLLETTMGTIENQKVDIWALGILAFEMFFGRRPFEAYSIEQLSKIYRKREYYLNLKGENNKISKEFIEFLNLCLQELPKERADVYCLQLTDFYNFDYKILEILDENELSSSLGYPDRDEQNNILLRIDKKYYEASTEENKQ